MPLAHAYGKRDRHIMGRRQITANAVLLALYLLRFHPTVIGRVYRDAPRTFVIGGNASYFAYVAVKWACLSALWR